MLKLNFSINATRVRKIYSFKGEARIAMYHYRNCAQLALKYLKSGIQSGTFIACMNALDKVKAEQAIDIFRIGHSLWRPW